VRINGVIHSDGFENTFLSDLSLACGGIKFKITKEVRESKDGTALDDALYETPPPGTETRHISV
jgi:hypothetical protein